MVAEENDDPGRSRVHAFPDHRRRHARGLLVEDPDVRLLDVRTPPSTAPRTSRLLQRAPRHARGARGELGRHLTEPVVLVCRSGNRASRAGERLASTGMSNLHVLEGGIQSWDDGQRPLRRGRERWDLERQVRLVAGGLVVTGIVGSLAVPRLKYLAGAVGAGLTVAALTDTCLMGTLLAKLPYNRDAGCDIDAVVRELTAA
ncbi:MAG: rhodanese-like domain-containing protein [Acidimicrobiia bacterium]|nr:rhodanese-like domain-containing protein [Acidimicrobiia bacterium]